ncbi:MAG: hypothetical protein WCO00_00100 [Rhodospirillaceae bacterium]
MTAASRPTDRPGPALRDPADDVGGTGRAADLQRCASEHQSRDSAKLIRYSKKLRNQIGGMRTADIEVRNINNGQLTGYYPYCCYDSFGRTRVASSISITQDLANPTSLPRAVITIAAHSGAAAKRADSLVTLNVVHELSDFGIRQVIYVKPTEIRYFLMDSDFRRADGVDPKHPHDLTISDLAILEHVRRFNSLPSGKIPARDLEGMIQLGLMAGVENKSASLRLTDKGAEWLLAATQQLRAMTQPRSALLGNRESVVLPSGR